MTLSSCVCRCSSRANAVSLASPSIGSVPGRGARFGHRARCGAPLRGLPRHPGRRPHRRAVGWDEVIRTLDPCTPWRAEGRPHQGLRAKLSRILPGFTWFLLSQLHLPTIGWGQFFRSGKCHRTCRGRQVRGACIRACARSRMLWSLSPHAQWAVRGGSDKVFVGRQQASVL